MGFRRRWMTLGAWLAPRGLRTLTNVSVVSVYLVLMMGLIIVPATLFLAITRRAGANVQGALVLAPAGRWYLYGAMAFTFLWSVLTGGFARALLRPRHLDWPWLALLALGLLLGLTKLGDEAREAIGQLHPGKNNDNAAAIAFFAFWLLMIGYAGKAVWDETRDRVAGIFEREIAKAAPLLAARGTGTETGDE